MGRNIWLSLGKKRRAPHTRADGSSVDRDVAIVDSLPRPPSALVFVIVAMLRPAAGAVVPVAARPPHRHHVALGSVAVVADLHLDEGVVGHDGLPSFGRYDERQFRRREPVDRAPDPIHADFAND